MHRYVLSFMLMVWAVCLPSYALAANYLMPHITGGEDNWSDILEVDNVGDTRAWYSIVLYDASGNTLYGPTTFSAAGGEYVTHNVKSLASNAACGYVETSVDILNFRISYENQEGGGVAEFTLTPDTGSTINFYFANASDIVEWKGLAVMNAGGSDTAATIKAWGNGAKLGEAAVTVPGHSRISNVCQGWFPEISIEDIERVEIVSASGALQGISISGDEGSSRMLFSPASTSTPAGGTLLIPHITGNQSDWMDILEVDNVSGSSGSFLLTVYDASGNALGSARQYTVAAYDYTNIDLKTDGGQGVCGVISNASAGLEFRVSYLNLEGGGAAQFVLPSGGHANLAFYFANFSSVTEWKGLAVMHSGSSSVQVVLNAYGQNGKLACATATIPAKSRISNVYQGWFPDIALGDLTRITVTSSSGQLSGIAITGNGNNSKMLFTAAGAYTPVGDTTCATGPVVTGSETTVLDTTVSTSGGTLTVSGTGTALDGAELTVPSGAFDGAAPVSMTYADISGHTLGSKVTPVTGLIRVKAGSGYANELLQLKIPVSIDEGDYAMGFYVDEETGELTGVPSVFADGHVSLFARRFGSAAPAAPPARAGAWESASILISSFNKDAMLAMDADSGFRPGVDDWEFSNRGSYTSPGGICSGMTMTAMYYYYNQKPSKGALYGNYDTLENLWQDNPEGYRWSSQAQKDNVQFDSLEHYNSYYDMVAKTWQDVYLSTAIAIYVTGQPQMLGVYSNLGGHALAAYRTYNRQIYVADPNWPGDQSRTVTLKADNTFQPYDGKLEQGGNNFTFPYILFEAKDANINWSLQEAEWREFEAGAAGDTLFPDYTLSVGQHVIETEYSSDKKNIQLAITSDVEAGDTLAIHVFDAEGNYIDGGYDADLELEEGPNRFGVYVMGHVSPYTEDSWEYVDFRWINVDYAVTGYAYTGTYDVYHGTLTDITGTLTVRFEAGFPFTVVQETGYYFPSIVCEYDPATFTAGSVNIEYALDNLAYSPTDPSYLSTSVHITGYDLTGTAHGVPNFDANLSSLYATETKYLTTGEDFIAQLQVAFKVEYYLAPDGAGPYGGNFEYANTVFLVFRPKS